MNEDKILSALQTAGIAAVAASIIPALPIKALGRTFDIPSDQKYLEFVYIPNNIVGEFWGDEKTNRGLFRLILHWPKDDKGFYLPLQAIGSIAGYFNKDMLLQKDGISVKITEKPDLTSHVETSSDILFPVGLRYSSFNP